MRHILQLMRPRQWAKNVFVAAPLFFGLELFDAQSAVRIGLAVALFCMLSSAIYVFNDLRDVAADRLHPKKRLRPLAAGTVTPAQAGILCAVLVVTALVLGLLINFPPLFYAYAGIYLLFSLAYSLGLKRINLVELFIVASGYVLRILAGCAAINAQPSPWIISATGVLALLIVAGKRRAEISMGASAIAPVDYSAGFLDTMIAVLGSATIVTYLLFTASDYAIQRYGQAVIITSVFVGYGVLRYIQLIQAGRGADEPTALVLTDTGIRLCVLLWAINFFLLVYLR